MISSCESCKDVKNCAVCNQPVTGFNHVGVRKVLEDKFGSGIYHYAQPCGHPVKYAPSKTATGGLAVYNGGPLWQAGFQWYDVFWGNEWTTDPLGFSNVDNAVAQIEADPSYSGGLSEYKVGQGSLLASTIITAAPPGIVSEQAIISALLGWINDKTIPDLRNKGAYNVFLPPGVTATLGVDASCVIFCDYHDTDGSGLYFTVEPYPCVAGCNQCTSSAFDTLTQGLSEEMTELKTDMSPGTGWVIGNEEVCDYCDASFHCNQISSGQYVNAWYSNKLGGCWSSSGTPPPPPPVPPVQQCINQIVQGINEVLSGQTSQGIKDIEGGFQCLLTVGGLDRKTLFHIIVSLQRAALLHGLSEIEQDIDKHF